MSQTKRDIQAILSAAGTEPRHRFGQNFMIDQNLVRLVADAGELTERDTVIEVGPGTGTLTEELLARAGRVIAVEIDRDLAGMLRERYRDNPKFTLIEGDALAGKHAVNAELLQAVWEGEAPAEPSPSQDAARQEPRPPVGGVGASPTHSTTESGTWAGHPRHVKLVANLPYNIASPLVIELLIAGVDLLVFTVQKEVADRLRADASTDAYGPLTVVAQRLAHVEVLRTLPPQAFWPMPKIDSALVRMRRDNRLGDDAPAFGRFVHQVFSARRKTLRKSLTNAGIDAEALLTPLQIDPQLRPENLSPAQFAAMFARLLTTLPAKS